RSTKTAKEFRAAPTINPNVAVELGYALHVLGDRALLMVMNEHYGSRADLPFDLQSRGNERSPVRNRCGRSSPARAASLWVWSGEHLSHIEPRRAQRWALPGAPDFAARLRLALGIDAEPRQVGICLVESMLGRARASRAGDSGMLPEPFAALCGEPLAA